MAEPIEVAQVHFGSCVDGPARIAAFYGAVRAAEILGHRVSVREWRDGMDRVYGLIASVPDTPPVSSSSAENTHG